jgi:hypothetical protein
MAQKRRINLRKYFNLIKKYVSDPKLCHPHPNDRFYAKHIMGESCVVGAARGDLCGGPGNWHSYRDPIFYTTDNIELFWGLVIVGFIVKKHGIQ